MMSRSPGETQGPWRAHGLTHGLAGCSRGAPEGEEIMEDKKLNPEELRRKVLTTRDSLPPDEILLRSRIIMVKIESLPARQVTIKGRTFTCTGHRVDAPGSFAEWGSDLKGVAYRCEDLPGAMVEVELESHYAGKTFTFKGRAVDFKIVKD